MYVRMLTAMAGDVDLAHGQVTQVDDRIGKAWIEAGLAERPPAAAASEKAAKDLGARVSELEAALADAEADRTALREQIAALVEQNAALSAAVATAAGSAGTPPAAA